MEERRAQPGVEQGRRWEVDSAALCSGHIRRLQQRLQGPSQRQGCMAGRCQSRYCGGTGCGTGSRAGAVSASGNPSWSVPRSPASEGSLPTACSLTAQLPGSAPYPPGKKEREREPGTEQKLFTNFSTMARF